ncbi:UNVERIFIED_CONTAM: hypothetical protein Scaly_0422300 [Sesamum calycinum]|uniref:FAF domain-containing protein n=1 Tax=Sesamum calycinum TaxID=2727403 RepID=A0AAW2SEZ0_9LAMI
MNSENLSLCTEGLGLESFDELENLLRIDFCNNGQCRKPWVCLKSFREDGRFILKEIRIPTQELLHACRENGRLKLQFIQPDDEASEEEANYKYVEKNNKHTGKKGRNQDEEGENENVEKRNCNGAREYANKKL